VRRRTVSAILVVLLASAACSSTKAAAPSQPAGSTAPAKCKDSGPLGSGHFTIGKQVKIGTSGFEPQLLVTGMNLTVTWKNTSSTPQSVHFDNWETPIDSGPIAPGASWSFKAVHTGSVLYHSTFDPCFKGQVQIQLTGNGAEPGG
jgi:plastocyanin